jgi:hypothetical protein
LLMPKGEVVEVSPITRYLSISSSWSPLETVRLSKRKSNVSGTDIRRDSIYIGRILWAVEPDGDV